jgi:hypothetical protein
LARRASRSHQIDHLSPELTRISGSVAESDISKINFNGVHQTGSTPLRHPTLTRYWDYFFEP